MSNPFAAQMAIEVVRRDALHARDCCHAVADCEVGTIVALDFFCGGNCGCPANTVCSNPGMGTLNRPSEDERDDLASEALSACAYADAAASAYACVHSLEDCQKSILQTTDKFQAAAIAFSAWRTSGVNCNSSCVLMQWRRVRRDAACC